VVQFMELQVMVRGLHLCGLRTDHQSRVCTWLVDRPILAEVYRLLELVVI